MVFRRYWHLLTYCLLINFFFGATASLAKNPNEISIDVNALARGVNIFYTVTEENGQLVHLDDPINQITQDDVNRIKQAGMTHIRLAVFPYPLMHDDRFDQNVWHGWNAQAYLQHVHNIIRLFLDNKMTVVLAVMVNEQSFERLYRNPDYVEEWTHFFHAWASEFSHYDSSLFAFETLNEPRLALFMSRDEPITLDDQSHYPDALLEKANAQWVAMEERFMEAIRMHAPDHTLIATADGFSDIRALSLRLPSVYSNVVYAFHYYLPLIFTHQNAHWAELPGSYIGGLTYPSDWDNCNQVKATSRPEDQHKIDQYCAQEWNFKRHLQEFYVIHDWGKKYGVPVWVSEFGAFPAKIEYSSLVHYYRDIRAIAEASGFGWCAWEYTNWLARLEDTSWIRY